MRTGRPCQEDSQQYKREEYFHKTYSHLNIYLRTDYKDSNKRAKKHQACLNIFTAMTRKERRLRQRKLQLRRGAPLTTRSIFGIRLRDTNKTEKKSLLENRIKKATLCHYHMNIFAHTSIFRTDSSEIFAILSLTC